MIEIDRLGNSVLVIEITQIAVQIRIVRNPPNVALEMAMIDSIKSNQRWKKTPASEIWLPTKYLRRDSRFSSISSVLNNF